MGSLKKLNGWYVDGNEWLPIKVDADGKLVLSESSGIIAPSGWIPVSATWAYASATTITVSSGAASIYQKGDKIKLTQTTVKYFYITAVADTLLTVTGGSDYTVANAAITLPYYSHIENPLGFPHWFNYVPTLTGSASDLSGYNVARFAIKGNILYLLFTALNKTLSGSEGSAQISLPVVGIQTETESIEYLHYGTSQTLATFCLYPSASYLDFYKDTLLTNFVGNETAVYIKLSLNYEI